MAAFALLAMLAIAMAALLRIFWTSWAERICNCCMDCDSTCVDCDNCWIDCESCWDCCESCWDCCESVAILLVAVTRALLRDEMVADGLDPMITLTWRGNKAVGVAYAMLCSTSLGLFQGCVGPGSKFLGRHCVSAEAE